MPLANGTKLGSFEILAPIGAGGMGEVYRARDETLGRLVAIKVLPDAFAKQPDRRARFEREAKLLASLNHPNVAAIYGLERSSETHYLVLELVEGETLGERIARGPIPTAEAVDIARQIAEGLEEAHERGVIHRDLKPGNVKLTPDGKVKVLDFGLAKAWTADGAGLSGSSSDLSQSPTFARPQSGTEAGVLLGTPAYMSPEQARGKEIDRRSDVWAFGVLLWEMLTGRQLFDGETASDVLAAVLTHEVDWNALPSATPRAVRRLLGRALERNPRKRLQAIGEARLVLEAPGDEQGGAALSADGSRRLRLIPVAVGLAILFFTLGWFLHSSTPAAEPVVRKVDLSISDLDVDERPVISPDGSHVAFIAGGQLQVRDLASFDAIVIPDTSDARYLFWSPDGNQLGYVAEGRAWKVTVGGRAGGTVSRPIDLGAVPDDLAGSGGGAWTDDGRIVLVEPLGTPGRRRGSRRAVVVERRGPICGRSFP